jgi:1-acyl-sn-glycerol-3-phosphate acyltransferase
VSLGTLRGALMMPLVMTWAFGVMAVFLALSFIPPLFRRCRGPIPRIWAKGIMFMYGIEWELRGVEHRRDMGPKIVLFNHVSTFDVVALAAVWRRDATIVYKKDFHRIPVMGALMQRLGFIPIDRKNLEKARTSLAQAARVVQEKGMALVIAPEGTRSGNGRLLPFKKGPFHLALETRAPLIPLVMTGLEEVMPAGAWFAKPGKVVAEYLPPISTEEWKPENMLEHMAEVRALFLERLPDGAQL